MEERTIKKGELYWINTSDAIGGEEKTGRPGVIISSNYSNERFSSVIIAYTTTTPKTGGIYPFTYASGIKSHVMCNQLRTIDKSRIEKYMGTLTEMEMSMVERGIRGALDIKYGDLEDELQTYRDLADQQNVEIAMLRKQYQIVLDQLVEMKVEADIAKRMAVTQPKLEVIEEQPAPEPEVVKEQPEPPRIMGKKVELNTCELDDLIGIGVNEDVGIRLIEGRPWKKVEDIRTVDGLTSMMYAVLKEIVTVTVVPEAPVVKSVKDYTWDEFKNLNEKLQLLFLDYHRNTLGEKETEIAAYFGVKPSALYCFTNKHPALLRNGQKPQKTPLFTLAEVQIPEGAMVNINTATAKEMSEQLGMPMKDAYSITGHRNKHGLFDDVEELLLVPRFTKNKFDMYREHICVTDEVPEVPKKPEGQVFTPAPVVKYNVNTASVYELQKAGFTKTQAHKIAHSRKMKGPFYELDDLLEVESVKKKDIRKLRDVLEV